MNREKPIILVVDPDPEAPERFKDTSEKDLIHFHVVAERPTAQLFIADKKNFVAGVVVSSRSCEPNGIPLVRFSKQARPVTPVYIALEEKEPEPEPGTVSALHLAGLLRKPLDRQDVTSKVFPYSYFDMERAMDLAKEDTAPAGTDVSLDDEKMHPIRAKDFLCGSQSYFDIFVRLGSGRYVKILKAGDAFDAKRVASYIEKGVGTFYIRGEAQEVFLQYCDSLTGIVLSKQNAPMDTKVSLVMSLGKETEDFLKQRGFNESTLLSAKQFVSHATTMVKQLKPERSPALKRFLSSVALCEHGTGVAMMVGLMLERLGFKDEKVIGMLALAAFTHDVGLLDMPPKLQEEDESSLTEEEYKLYVTHPIVGYEMMRNIRLINPMVPATILEHHERRTGQGFPYNRGSGMISQAAEVIGIADTFLQLLKKAARSPEFNLVTQMETMVYNEFSFPVMDAFDKTFLKTLTSPC